MTNQAQPVATFTKINGPNEGEKIWGVRAMQKFDVVNNREQMYDIPITNRGGATQIKRCKFFFTGLDREGREISLGKFVNDDGTDQKQKPIGQAQLPTQAVQPAISPFQSIMPAQPAQQPVYTAPVAQQPVPVTMAPVATTPSVVYAPAVDNGLSGGTPIEQVDSASQAMPY